MSELSVVGRFKFTDYERYMIAWYNDVFEGEKTSAQWNKKPRLATRNECRKYIEDAMGEQQLHIGDMCPNFKADGTTEERPWLYADDPG